jgi:phenylpropionate dioxygenase-like ring-hydroxylating dioxygenase large terminal subunit
MTVYNPASTRPMTVSKQNRQSNNPFGTEKEFFQRIAMGLEYERSRRQAPEHFPALPPIPAGRYTDPDFLKLEREHLWKKSWQYVCHADQIPATGDYLLWNASQSPIVIVRGQDRAIRAFYNTCRHRGAPLVSACTGTVKGGFTCGYHGWAYSLDGRLVGIRDRRDFPGLDFDCLGLVPVNCESLGKWIFVNEDPAAPPLDVALQPFTSQLGRFDLTASATLIPTALTLPAM